MRAFLVAAILTLTLLAGCSGDVPMLTAKQTLPSADQAAAVWADDAVLHAVVTIELGDDIKSMIRQEMDAARESGEMEESGMSPEDEAMLDAMLSGHDSPGDGRAAFWGYAYVSEARQSYFVVVVSANGVEFAEEVDMGWEAAQSVDGDSPAGDELRPIEGWEIDSDAAAAAAMSDETYRSLAGDPKAMGITVLAMEEDTPYWVLILVKIGWDEEDWESEAYDEDGEPASGDWEEGSWEEPRVAVVLVNARDGSVVPLDEEDLDDFAQVGPVATEAQQAAEETIMEFGSASGELTVLAPQSAHSFAIEQEGHEAIALAVEASSPLVAPIEVTVTDPEGRQTVFEVPMALGGLQSRQSVVLDIVPQGDWAVELALDPALRTTYTLEWCTDGVGMPDSPFGTSVGVCDEVPGNGSYEPPVGAGLWGFLLGRA